MFALAHQVPLLVDFKTLLAWMPAHNALAVADALVSAPAWASREATVSPETSYAFFAAVANIPRVGTDAGELGWRGSCL